MKRPFDPTQPGPAGLFFRTENLSSIGWQQENAARVRLERWCQFCGQTACYGYGVSLSEEGTWSCSDASCRSSAEAEIARRNCPSPLAKLSDETATLDLFRRVA